MSKTPDISLFDLIKSMSPSEKRYFRRVQLVHSDNESSKGIVIFDLVAQMDKYDEQALLRKLKAKNMHEHLAFNKQRLYAKILGSLRGFHKGTSVEIEILNLLQNIRITFDKGLYKQSAAILKKLKAKCMQHDLTYYLIHVNQWERVFNDQQISINRKKIDWPFQKSEKKRLTKNLIELLKYFEDDLNLWNYKIELIDIFRFGRPQNRLKIETVYQEHNALKSKKMQHYPIDSKLKGVHIETFYGYFSKKPGKALREMAMLIKFLEDNPKLIEADYFRYSVLINNYVYTCFEFDRIDGLKPWIDMLRDLLDKKPVRNNKYLFSRVYVAYQLNTLLYFNRLRQFNEAIATFNDAAFEKNSSILTPVQNFQINCQIALAYFFSMEYRTCLRSINKILSSPVMVLPNDLSFVRVIQYLVYYKLGNFSLLESALTSTDRTIKHNLRKYRTERLILILKHLNLKMGNPDKAAKASGTFMNKIEPLRQSKKYEERLLFSCLKELK